MYIDKSDGILHLLLLISPLFSHVIWFFFIRSLCCSKLSVGALDGYRYSLTTKNLNERENVREKNGYFNIIINA